MPQIVRGAGGPYTAVRWGNFNINEIRLGATRVWAKAALRIDFTQIADRLGLGSDWVDSGPATSPYVASVQGGSCRINLPDTEWYITEKRSRMRYTGAYTGTNDGYLEIGVGSWGHWDPVFQTIVYDNMLNTSFDDGIGIGLWANTVHIVRRVGGVETEMASGGGFQTGDRVRLVHSNQGKFHSLFVNGRLSCVWDDSAGTANVGPSNRSIGLSVYGKKDVFFFPRCYSPGIAYIEAGAGDVRPRPVAVSDLTTWNSRSLVMSFGGYIPVEGDLILVFACYTNTPDWDPTTPPPGWTDITVRRSAIHAFYSLYHLVTADEAAAAQTSWELANYFAGFHWTGVSAVVFRGVDRTTPIDAFATSASSDSFANPHVLPGLPGGSLSTGSLVVGSSAVAFNGTYPSEPPSGWETVTVSGGQTRGIWSRTALTQAGVNVPAVNVTPTQSGMYIGITVALTQAPTS